MVIPYSLDLTVHRIYVIWTSILCCSHFLEWVIIHIFQMIIRLPAPMNLTSKVSTTVIFRGYLHSFLHAALPYPFHLVFMIPVCCVSSSLLLEVHICTEPGCSWEHSFLSSSIFLLLRFWTHYWNVCTTLVALWHLLFWLLFWVIYHKASKHLVVLKKS